MYILLSMILYAMSSTIKQEEITITVKVVNVSSDTGKVGFALYDKNSFMTTPLQSSNIEIKEGISEVKFVNILPGEYAVVCYHDKNNNGKMDFTTNGMPLEDYGASNNVMNFGPPTFENAKFNVSDKNVYLEIKF